MPRRYDVVLIDCYGTLLHEDPAYPGVGAFLRSQKVDMAQDDLMSFWTEDIKGDDHSQFSGSRRGYKVWARTRRVPFLENAGVTDAKRRKEILLAFEEWAAKLPFLAYPEVLAALTAVREQGARVVVASNWDWDIEPALDSAGLLHLIDDLAVSARMGFRKPHPAFYAVAIDIAGIRPSEALFVGDNWSHDVEGAMAAGISAVHLDRTDDPIGFVVNRGPAVSSATRITDLSALPDLIS